MTEIDDLLENIRPRTDVPWDVYAAVISLRAAFNEIRAERDALREALEEWEHCAQYDAMMEGPRFKGWDRSQMERCRKRMEAARAALQTSPELSEHIVRKMRDEWPDRQHTSPAAAPVVSRHNVEPSEDTHG